MAKHCMDCGLKLLAVDEKHKPVRYECAVCNAYWVHTIKTTSIWEKFIIGNESKESTNIQASGFSIRVPSAEDIIKEASKNPGPLTADKVRQVAELYLDGMPLNTVFPVAGRREPSRELMDQTLKAMQHVADSSKEVTPIEGLRSPSREHMTRSITANEKLQHELGIEAKGTFVESVAEANARLLKQAEESVIAMKLDEIILDHKAQLGHDIIGTAGIQGIKDDKL